VQDLTLYFRALADRKRFRILYHLARHDEVTVSELGEELRLSQPLISWHLRRLRRLGLVTTRRSGRQVRCSLNRSELLRFNRLLEEVLELSPSTASMEDPGRPLEAAGQR
jgi:ArsR family transcriptional regulator, arsenate/arsenite/antimonite-responsive transcriptional repressor